MRTFILSGKNEVQAAQIIFLLIILTTQALSSCCDEGSWPNCLETDPEPDTTILRDFPVIDVHQHIYNSASFWSTESEAGYIYYNTPIEHYEELVRQMTKNNVVLSVAGGSLSAVDYYTENYPENSSLFLYSAEYWKIEEATLQITLSRLRKAIKDQRICSIGELCGIYNGVALDDPTYMSLYTLADSCSLPVIIHTGIVPKNVHDGFPVYGFEKSNPTHLKPVLEMYPNINFNAAHWGSSTRSDYNFEDDVIEMLQMYDNFFVDLGYTLWLNRTSKKASKRFLERAIEEGLEDKILYGSDEMIWPDAVTASINFIKQADFLSEEQKKKILYWNAASYLNLSEGEIASHFYDQ